MAEFSRARSSLGFRSRASVLSCRAFLRRSRSVSAREFTLWHRPCSEAADDTHHGEPVLRLTLLVSAIASATFAGTLAFAPAVMELGQRVLAARTESSPRSPPAVRRAGNAGRSRRSSDALRARVSERAAVNVLSEGGQGRSWLIGVNAQTPRFSCPESRLASSLLHGPREVQRGTGRCGSPYPTIAIAAATFASHARLCAGSCADVGHLDLDLGQFLTAPKRRLSRVATQAPNCWSPWALSSTRSATRIVVSS